MFQDREMEFDLGMKIKDEDLDEYGSEMGLPQNSFSKVSVPIYLWTKKYSLVQKRLWTQRYL